jgi:hypothetical protein
MKKLFFAVLFTAIAMTSMNAQKIGAKVGLNIATLSGDIENTKMKMGLHIGAVAEFEITEQFTFQPELVFSMQGTKYDDGSSIDGLGGLDDPRLKLTYINVPLMAKYYVTESVNIQVGPQVGFLMSANSSGFFGDDDVDVKDNMNSLDYGVNFGAGYVMDFGLFIDARYNLGLANIRDSDNITIKNNVISVSVGYFFN